MPPDPSKRWHNEDFDNSLGFVDYSGMVVLDIGADYGSTPYYFLQDGAKKVIALEAHRSYAAALGRYAAQEPRLEGFHQRISCACDFEQLFSEYKPDIAKIDCEGCEGFLLDASDEVLSMVPEYVIEIHNQATAKYFRNYHDHPNGMEWVFKERFENLGYKVKVFKPIGVWVVWARREND